MRAPKTTFKPVLAKLPGFQNYLFESNHFLGFVTILHFWRSIYRKYVLVCWQRNWDALKLRSQKTAFFKSKIRFSQLWSRKTCFGLFPVKLCFLQGYYTGKRFSSSFQRGTPRFTWFYSRERFYLILAKLRCFRILSLRRTFSFVFVTKIHFWCSILPKKCGLLGTKLGRFEPHVTKKFFFQFCV